MKSYQEWGLMSVAIALSVFVARVAIWQYFDTSGRDETTITVSDSPISTPPPCNDNGRCVGDAVAIELSVESSEVFAKAIAETHKQLVRRDLNSLIDLQSVVDRWVGSYSSGFSEAAVEIFDVDYNTVVASYRPNAVMYPRSLYKLFYVYDAYAQIDAGIDSPDQIYFNGQTLGHCLDIIIRFSDNPCAEQMIDNDPPRLARVGQLISNLGLYNTQSDGLRTSAHDISLLLQHYYRHPEWSGSSWQKFRSSALGQSWTYRKGLPSGFTTATVYDKTGFGYGSGGVNVYNDAAMVEFPTNGGVRRYIIVVMTINPSSYSILTKLGAMLESAILYGV